MRDDVFAKLKLLTEEQREVLRQRLVDRKLLDTDSWSRLDHVRDAFELGALDRARIEAAVPGGKRNIEDVYPLTALQEGMLFHHLLERDADPYVLHQVMRFPNREALEQVVEALRVVVGRHGILRSAVLWEGLTTPVQVVCRSVALPLREIETDDCEVDPEWLIAQSSLSKHRVTVHEAPLIKLLCAQDASRDWLLLIASHHLIADRTSLQLMQDEMAVIMANGGQTLPQVCSFGAYALKVWAAGHQRERAFFTELLGDVNAPTTPFGLIDAVDARAALIEARCILDRDLAHRLREQACRHGVSVSTLLHVSWALVLARVSGSNDLVFGTVLSGRMRTPIETGGMLGMLVNTLPFRVKLRGRSVFECIKEAHHLLLRLIEHEQAPLALARQASAVPAPIPLFSALLDYRRDAGGGQASREIEFVAGHEQTSFPLTLSVNDSGDAVECIVQTFEHLGPDRIVGYLKAALEQLCEALAHEPHRHVTCIDVLPQHEAVRLIGSGQPALGLGPGLCVHRLFDAQVARAPQAMCVVSDTDAVSYGEMGTRVNRLARHLRRLGVRAETRVALCMPRGIDLIVAMLAVMKAGGAYVPLDPAYPPARLCLLAKLSAPALVLGQGDGPRDLFSDANIPIVDLRNDGLWPGGVQEDINSEWDETFAQLAYVMFTSGSTGQPKGVMVQHSNLAAFVRAQALLCQLDENDRVLQFASHSFDNSVAEIFPALTVGATIVLRPDAPIAPDEAFIAFLARHRVTVADLPTAFWHLWAQRLGTDDPAYRPRPPLRLVLAGGEPMHREALDKWFGAVGTTQIRMLDTYGLTETTVNSIAGELLPADTTSDTRQALALGRPLGDTRVYILDPQGRLAPIGVVGEIHIGGSSLARGYLSQPSLTAGLFVPDPFGAPSARLYRTGDLGYRTDTGDIVYRGRLDTQIKIRGCRIEPSEIEMFLRSVKGVEDAKVIARGDRLVAYVVGSVGRGPCVETLRSFLSEQLPSFMVPSSIAVIPELPLNTHGKIDVRQLPELAQISEPKGNLEQPRTSTEKLVEGIWRELLEHEHISRHDDFFALGGHSLLAIRVVSRVRDALGAALNVRDVFSHPTLAMFAKAVERSPRVGPMVIPSMSCRDIAPLSLAQERLWFLSRFDVRKSVAYHLTGGLRFLGDIDVPALKGALTRIVHRHEILRTVFREENGVPQAVLMPPEQGVAWSEQDLTSHNDPESELPKLLARVSDEPFDFKRGPMLRLILVKLGKHDHALIAAMHHIVADGWSMSILVNELTTLYICFAKRHDDPLAPLPIQYADYAAWQREQSAHTSDGLQFWRNHLQGAPICLTLPTDRPRPRMQDHEGASVSFVLDRALTHALSRLAAKHGATLYMTLMVGYAVLLSRIAGQHSVVIGSPVANRPSVELERLIGFFANVLALRIDLADSPTVAQSLAQVRHDMLAAQEYQHIPFEQIVDALNPPRSVSHGPLFQAMLVWQNTPPSRIALDGIELREIHPEVVAAQCDLSLMMEERSGEIAGSAVYAKALFDRSTIERYLEAWRTILISMADDDSQRVDQLPLARRFDEVAQPAAHALGQPSIARVEDPPCLHMRFAQCAARNPDALAVSDATRSMSYAELNAASNRLARHLRRLGVGQGVFVALALARSVDLVIGVLAVLKAGGAYVPLDLAAPAGRLREIISDCQPTVMLLDQDGVDVSEAASDMKVVHLHGDASAWAQMPSLDLSNAEVLSTPQDPAYVIYTSGSTGRPKGVVVEHAQVVSLLVSLEPAFMLGASDVWTLFHSIAFDFSVWELFGALLHGARLLIVPQAVTREPAAFYRLICREGVTVLSQTPSAFKQLATVHKRAQASHRLRHVVFGGEKLDACMLASWSDTAGLHQTMFTDMYGITECTVFSTSHQLRAQAALEDTRGCVGEAIIGQYVYVLDEQLQPVLAGELGEIWIGGSGLARGYLSQPALTAERFLPDPFSMKAGARMFRSGDFGRLRLDGRLMYVGRRDEQVKIRGFRVELGEIAARLTRHPGVGQAIVRVMVAEEDGARLIAYFKPRDSDVASPSPEGLRTYLMSELPDYMIPVAYVRVDSFPLTLNGKIDKEALDWPKQCDYPKQEYEPPRGDTEIWLADEWASLLGIERVGRHDQFFELGGHSLLIAQLLARIHRQFDVDLPMSEMFESPVLHEFAARIVVARLAQFDSTELAKLAASRR